jgi:hypothetical protein
MAQADTTLSTFHITSRTRHLPTRSAMPTDAVLKGVEAECKALKEEFKSRRLLTAAGEQFTITRSDQISSRLDVAAVKQFLGDAWRRFETAGITTVIRIKAVKPLAIAA